MKIKSILIASAVATLLAAPMFSSANSGVEKLTQNPSNWATALGNYAGTRYSELKQITTENVKNLQPAWSFSTGILRGHEGGPLVINDVVFIHTPFPNTVYALDQKKLTPLFGNILHNKMQMRRFQ
jgi:glucose dehydrogenase